MPRRPEKESFGLALGIAHFWVWFLGDLEIGSGAGYRSKGSSKDPLRWVSPREIREGHLLLPPALCGGGAFGSDKNEPDLLILLLGVRWEYDFGEP